MQEGGQIQYFGWYVWNMFQNIVSKGEKKNLTSPPQVTGIIKISFNVYLQPTQELQMYTQYYVTLWTKQDYNCFDGESSLCLYLS